MPLLWVKGVVKSGDELAYHLMIRDYYICVHAFDDADLLALFMNNRDLSGLAYNDIWFLEISLDYWNYRDRFVSQEVFSLLEKEFTVQQEKKVIVMFLLKMKLKLVMIVKMNVIVNIRYVMIMSSDFLLSLSVC